MYHPIVPLGLLLHLQLVIFFWLIFYKADKLIKHKLSEAFQVTAVSSSQSGSLSHVAEDQEKNIPTSQGC